MFERLMARLHRDTPPKEPLATPDARMALGILLVRLAMVDRAYLFEEVEDQLRHDVHPVDIVFGEDREVVNKVGSAI